MTLNDLFSYRKSIDGQYLKILHVLPTKLHCNDGN